MKTLFTSVLLLLFFSSLTIVNAQTPITPTDASSGVSQATATVTWTDFDGGNGNGPYDVEFDDDAGFGSVDASASSTAATSLALPALLYNTTYNWRVRDTDTDGGGADGAWNTYSFTTEIATPSVTAFVGAQTITPTVNWTFTGGTTGVTFDVEVATDAGFTSIVHTSAGLAGTSTSEAISTSLNNNTDYWVRVTAKKAGESDKTSSSQTFFTVITSPTITSPTPSENGVSLTPTITWLTNQGTASGLTFDVEIDDDPGFGSVDYSSTGLAAGTTSHTVGSALTAGTNYNVRVTAKKASESDEASAAIAFQVGYAQVSLTSPGNESVGVNINHNVFFDWAAVAGTSPGFYQIQISTSSSFGTTEIDQYITDPTTDVSLDLSSLDYYSTYYWRVRATESNPFGSDNVGAWSSVWEFRTIDNYHANLRSPQNTGTNVPSGSATFVWDVTNRINYGSFLFPKFRLVVDTQNDFASGNAIIKDGISVTTFFLGLDAGTTYYWKVITLKDGNDGENYQDPATSGALIVGRKYQIQTYVAGDDFTNVGAASNANGVEFIATGTTPTTWTNSSELIVADDVGVSPTWSFTTDGAVVKPIIAYPKEETTAYSTTPIMYWYTLGFHVDHEYEIEWSATQGNLSADQAVLGSAGASSRTGITGLFSYPSTPLTGGDHIYWQVRTKIGTTVSDWSDMEDFYVFDQADAQVPNAAYPTGGVEVYNRFPRLYWTLSGPSLGLEFQIRYGLGIDGSNDVDVSGTLNTDYWVISDISQLYVTLLDGLVGGTTYYWQVRSTADNGSTYSGWSDYAEFKIYDFAADLVPILSWPIGGNIVYSTDVNFAWHVEGPSLGITYDIDYALDATGGDDVDGTPEQSGLSDNLLTISGIFTSGNTYEWRVRVTDTDPTTAGDQNGTWSGIETFKVLSSGSSNVPILNWPVGGATVWATSQDLSWTIVGSTAGLSYVVYYDDNSGMSSPDSITGLSSTSTTLSGLTAGTTYYWKVRSDVGAAVGQWSNTEVFVVFSGVSPAVPLVGSPSGVEVSTSSPTLSWFSPTHLDHAVTYEVEYSKESSMNNSTVVGDLSSPSYQASNLSSGTYYWRSRTKNNDGSYSDYTETARFDVSGVTDAEKVSALPTEYSLDQNYPNPFNPSTTIRYNVPVSEYVSIKIYNMLGQEVRTLVNKETNAGSYQVVWNGKDNFGSQVSSGTYIYRIVSGSFIQTKKMILLK